MPLPQTGITDLMIQSWKVACIKCFQCRWYVGIQYALNFMTPSNVIYADTEGDQKNTGEEV